MLTYFLKENVFIQVQKLTASDAEELDCFGNSVSLYGDYALIGTAYENGEGMSRGAVYIFER